MKGELDRLREEAEALADQLVGDGEVDPPRTQMEGYRLMKACYAEVAKNHPKRAQTRHAPTDTGLRGLSHTEIGDSEEFKPGTLDEVAADMAQKMKAGKWRKAFASA